jgi:hypothetical protein
VAIQRYYAEGHSFVECRAEFGFSAEAWSDAVRRGAIIARPRAMPVEELLFANTHRGRWHLKARLLASGLKQDRCERCGISTWRGEPLVMALHHESGDPNDNRLENLRLLCPNCHGLTPNFGGRNRRPRGSD